jgi:hypothetical protein
MDMQAAEAKARSLLIAAEAMMTMTNLEVVKSWNFLRRCSEENRKVELVVVKTLYCHLSKKMGKVVSFLMVLTISEVMNFLVMEGWRTMNLVNLRVALILSLLPSLEIEGD